MYVRMLRFPYIFNIIYINIGAEDGICEFLYMNTKIGVKLDLNFESWVIDHQHNNKQMLEYIVFFFFSCFGCYISINPSSKPPVLFDISQNKGKFRLRDFFIQKVHVKHYCFFKNTCKIFQAIRAQKKNHQNKGWFQLKWEGGFDGGLILIFS